VIYVADTKPGDRAKVKVVRITEKAAHAEVIK